MKKYNNEIVRVLCERKTIHSIECDECSKELLPEKNKTYYELNFMKAGGLEYLEHHLCSSYCLNKFVSKNSFDNSIGGIEFNKIDLLEEIKNDNTIRIIEE